MKKGIQVYSAMPFFVKIELHGIDGHDKARYSEYYFKSE